MRVALVTSIPHGGPVEHALLLARDLRADGVAVTAVAGSAALAARFSEVGADAVGLAMDRRLDPAGVRRLRHALAGADVVHSHDRRSGLWTALMPAAGAPRVHTIHGIPDAYLPAPIGGGRPGLGARFAYRGIERWAAQRADAVVVPSAAAADVLVTRLGYRRDALTIVANGVDDRPTTAATGTLVGTISALEPVKGLDVFLRAAALLAAERPELGFVVYGDGALAPGLRSLAAALGLADRVRFPGHVPVAEAFASLAVLVSSSHMETSGLAIMESMAAGVPVVATRVGAVPETAPDATASLVAPGDPAEIAAAVGALLDDPGARAEQARRAHALMNGRGGSRVVARRMLELYRSLSP